MNFKQILEKIGSFGKVTKVNPPLVKIEGLTDPAINNLIIFENGSLGSVYQIEKNYALATLLDNHLPPVGSKAVDTKEALSLKFSIEALGKIIDPLGREYYTKSFLPKSKNLSLNPPPAKIDKRRRIKKQFNTGVILVDLIIPLGKGQRELILGGKKTGKSSFLKMVAKARKKEPEIIIYAIIGKRASEVEELREFFEKEGLAKKTIIIATLASHSPALVSLTPFSALTVAEFLRDQGIDTIVMLDDLSIHAKFYRELSLLAKRPPGRESYPGDIFYTHARLLERAGYFEIEGKEVAITCLPVAESLEEDITGFIPTNLMSITDGHLFFDPRLYSQGKRPAINPYLSVTRVGKQAQTPVKRELNLKLLSLLTQYEEAQKLAHLSTELSEKTRKILKFGKTLQELFQQYTDKIYEPWEELALAGASILAYEQGKELKIDELKENLEKFSQIKDKIEGAKNLKELLEVLKTV